MALTSITGAFVSSLPVVSSSPSATKTATRTVLDGKTSSGKTGAAVVVSAGARRLGDPASPLANSQSPDLVAEWRNALSDRQKADISALTQLQAMNKGMHKSRHDDASLRLQQLLEQFHTLRMLGANSKTLKELAKEIKAAASDLAASGDGGNVDPSASVAGMNDTPAAMDAAATTATNASTAAGAGIVQTVADASAASAGDQTASADPPTSGAATPPTSSPQKPAQPQWQQLMQQVNDAGAKARQRADDDMLLQEARATISQIERMIKRAEEAKRHKPDANAIIDKLI